MKLFKRRAKPDEIKTEALTDDDNPSTPLSTGDIASRSERAADASSGPAGEAGGDGASDTGSSIFERSRVGLSRSRWQSP